MIFLLLHRLRFKREIRLIILIYLIFVILLFRICYLQKSEISLSAGAQSQKSILISESRGYIYDRNYIPLVNEEKTDYYAYISDDTGTSDFTSQANSAKRYRNGIIYNDNSVDADKATSYSLISRYSDNNLCRHFIGYTDSEGNGVCGIEKSFDRILLEASGRIELNYITDGRGNVIKGEGISLTDNNYGSPAGIVLTIDKYIQTVAESALENSDIECGAVVILKADTSEILAGVSIPSFDQNNVELSLESENAPFLNRIISSYPVGSVFKPFVAATALENGYNLSESFYCNGRILLNDTEFSCYNFRSHGNEFLNDAVSASCNLFFINMGLECGAQAITDIASALGFGKSIKLCSEIFDSGGNLPQSNIIDSDAQLANLCFGQGELLASPLQIAAAYCALANGGYYRRPVLLKELINDENEIYGYYKNEDPKKVLSDETCEIINISLYNNMLNGTGSNACPENVSSAGKTATAQTGRYESGNELLCTWFAGFVPYENPEYVIVVFNENGSAASQDCAPVFKEIAQKLY